MRIKRIERDDAHSTSIYMDDDMYEKIQDMYINNNPFISTMPILTKYRVGDIIAFLIGLGIERFDDMTVDEIEEAGLRGYVRNETLQRVQR